jgi:hypothetical protein
VEGTLCGLVLGDFTGDIGRDLEASSRIAGTMKGVVHRDLCGYVRDDFEGVVRRNMSGGIGGNFKGMIKGDFTGEVYGNFEGIVRGNFVGVVHGTVRLVNVRHV